MIYQTLSYEIKERVALIRITSPKTGPLNSDQLTDELTDLCAEIGTSGEARVVILGNIGENTFFEQGNDPGSALRSISEPIARLDLPVIASIDEDAVGQGLELALACDIRVSVEASRFGFPHIHKGIIPSDGGTQRLPRLVGRSRALEMILIGEMIDAQEAYRLGLVNEIVPPRDLATVVMKMAQEMASKGPIALRYAKEAIYKGMDMTLEQGLRLEADLYLLIHTSKDRTEGISAFREKRTPKFEGK